MTRKVSETFSRARHQGLDETLEWLLEHQPDETCKRCNKRGLTRGEAMCSTCTDCLGREQSDHNQNRMKLGMAPLYCTCRDLPDDEYHSQGYAFKYDLAWPGDRTRGYAIEIDAGEERRPKRKLCGTWERYLRNQPEAPRGRGKMGLVD